MTAARSQGLTADDVAALIADAATGDPESTRLADRAEVTIR